MGKYTLLLILALLTTKYVSGQDDSSNQTASNRSTENTIEDCIRSCPVTSEYNPVCGSNGVTYDNPGRLICAQECGVNVTLKKWYRCSRPVPDSS